jgi:O-antigen/teichoic acid export membrane protein
MYRMIGLKSSTPLPITFFKRSYWSGFRLQSASYIVSTLVYQFTNFITLYILNGHLQDYFFAKFILIQNLSSVLGMIVSMGMNPNSLSILCKQHEREGVWTNFFAFIVINSFTLYCLCFIFNLIVPIADFSVFICLFYLTFVLENNLSYLAVVELKTNLIMVVSVVRFILLPLLILLLIHPDSLTNVFLCYSSCAFISSLIYCIGLKIKLRSINFGFFYTRSVLKINLPFFISNISLSLSEYFLNSMLFSYKEGAKFIRVNTILKQLTNLLLFIPNKTLFLMVPKMLNSDSKESSRRMLVGNLFLYGILVLIFLVFRNFIYTHYRFPTGVMNIDLLTCLFFAWGVLSIGNQYFGNKLIIAGKHITRNIADIILALLNLLMFWFLIRSLPQFAYVLASITSFLAVNLFVIYSVRKR